MLLWIVVGSALLGLIIWTWFAPRMVGLTVMSFACIALVGSALPLVLPGSIVSSLIWVGVTLPLAWMLLMFWCYADASRWRPLAGMFVMCVLAGIALFMLEPGV